MNSGADRGQPDFQGARPVNPIVDLVHNLFTDFLEKIYNQQCPITKLLTDYEQM